MSSIKCHIVIKNCHQKMSSKIVIKNCHQNLSSKFVIKICHQKLSSISQRLWGRSLMSKIKRWLSDSLTHSVSDKVTYWAVRWQLKIYIFLVFIRLPICFWSKSGWNEERIRSCSNCLQFLSTQHRIWPENKLKSPVALVYLLKSSVRFLTGNMK